MFNNFFPGNLVVYEYVEKYGTARQYNAAQPVCMMDN